MIERNTNNLLDETGSIKQPWVVQTRLLTTDLNKWLWDLFKIKSFNANYMSFWSLLRGVSLCMYEHRSSKTANITMKTNTFSSAFTEKSISKIIHLCGLTQCLWRTKPKRENSLLLSKRWSLANLLTRQYPWTSDKVVVQAASLI